MKHPLPLDRFPEAQVVHPPPLSLRTVTGVMCSCVLVLAVIETMPALIGILGTHYQVPSRDLGVLAAGVLACYIAGTFLTNAFTLEQLARWTPWACLATGAVNLACMVLVGRVPLQWIYPLSALGGGMCYGYMLKVIDRAGQQRRSMGIYLALINFNVFAGFQLITYATETLSHSAVFVVYGACALGAGLLTLASRRAVLAAPRPSVAGAVRASAPPLPRRLAFCALALAVSYVAFGAIWPFVQIIGTSRGFSPFMVANALSAYSVTAILGSLLAAALPVRLRPATVLLLALASVLLSIRMLCGTGAYGLFATGCILWGLYWPFSYALQTAVVAKPDRSGKAIVLCGIAPSVGMVLGSFLGGRFLEGPQRSSVEWIAIGSCLVGALGLLALLPRPASRPESFPKQRHR